MAIAKFLCCFLLLIITACDPEPQPAKAAVVPISGKIEIYNSSGLEGAASEFKDFLKARGFDILRIGTDPNWANHEETIIAINNRHWIGGDALRSVLNTKNFIPLQDTSIGNVDATIYIGKDYKKVINSR